MARRHTASWERGRCPRVDLQSASGRLGYQSPGIMTGMGGASLDWDRRRRVTPVQTASQEAWPEADLGDEILPEMRAAVERRQACALQKGARRIARCGGCDPAFAGVPLPSLFLSLCPDLFLGFGETGVANKETEAPPLSFHILPGLRASRGRVLQRSGEEARRENDACCPVRRRSKALHVPPRHDLYAPARNEEYAQ
jgi:hypothetical protein